MKRICLVALLGLPAVGKTTICNHLMQMETLPFNILHLCYDDYINFDSKNPTQYKEQREHVLKTLTSVVKHFKISNTLTTELNFLKSSYKDQQRNDLVIICDDNHYYFSMRYKLYQLAREYGIGYCQIYFESSVDLAIERNILRRQARKVPNDVIIQMSKRLEAPNILSNNWEENTLTVRNDHNFNKKISEEIAVYILQFLDKPVKPLQISVNKSITSQSKVHELDLLMRKHINNLLSSQQGENKKLFAKTLNDKRKDILKQFQLEVPTELQDNINLNKYVEKLN